MTTSVGRADPGGTAITTAETDGTGITTAETDGTAITTADPATTVASVGPVTMAEATMVGPATMAAAATTKTLPAQVTVAAHATVTFVRYVPVSAT
jgi:hypothetical protein